MYILQGTRKHIPEEKEHHLLKGVCGERICDRFQEGRVSEKNEKKNTSIKPHLLEHSKRAVSVNDSLLPV